MSLSVFMLIGVFAAIIMVYINSCCNNRSFTLLSSFIKDILGIIQAERSLRQQLSDQVEKNTEALENYKKLQGDK